MALFGPEINPSSDIVTCPAYLGHHVCHIFCEETGPLLQLNIEARLDSGTAVLFKSEKTATAPRSIRAPALSAAAT
jgi:hypothetical protein